MSNNRFLQSKEQNKSNRFNFLDSEEPNKKSLIKNKKNNQLYDSFNNSFTKKVYSRNNDKKQRKQTETHISQKDNNHFRETPTTPEFSISDELFPSLTPLITTSQNNVTNFKDALNQNNEIIVEEDITLRPGWVQISKVNNKIIINQANIGPYDIKRQQIQELHQDPNYIMNQLICSSQKNWLKHKTIYDKIYGEGAYDDLHYLSPMYDSDTDYNTDEDDSLSDDNIDELADY